MARPKNVELREFVLRQIPEHPNDIATLAARTFGVSRSLVNGYLKKVIEEGLVEGFDKITLDCKLSDKHEAILELSKGKLTTDSSRHTGEGIFFTSRMFDRFTILSGGLAYVRSRASDDDWLIDVEDAPDATTGTGITMQISTKATQTTTEVFEKYVDDNDRFSRTHVPLALAKYEGENLVSRSQARRLLARVERFSEVMLDFKGVAEIGQA